MSVSAQDMLEIDPNDVFFWEVENLEAGLAELGIMIEPKQSQSRKVYELKQAILRIKSIKFEPVKPKDPNMMMMRYIKAMQQQMAAQMDAITEKVSGSPNNTITNGPSKRSNAKGHCPEKFEREVDFATFLQWQKSWKLYTISDDLEALTDQRQIAILFGFLSKELLSDLEYWFKVNIYVEQKVNEVMEAMKTNVNALFNI